jgi:hypothetical protein
MARGECLKNTPGRDAPSEPILSECTYEAEVNLLWTPHNPVSVCALRAQIPTPRRRRGEAGARAVAPMSSRGGLVLAGFKVAGLRIKGFGVQNSGFVVRFHGFGLRVESFGLRFCGLSYTLNPE